MPVYLRIRNSATSRGRSRRRAACTTASMMAEPGTCLGASRRWGGRSSWATGLLDPYPTRLDRLLPAEIEKQGGVVTPSALGRMRAAILLRWARLLNLLQHETGRDDS